jgi:hypothetical protein
VEGAVSSELVSALKFPVSREGISFDPGLGGADDDALILDKSNNRFADPA